MDPSSIAPREQVLSPPQEERRPQDGGKVAQVTGAKRLPIFLKADEVAALLSAVDTLRDLLILRLLYFSALRISEVLGHSSLARTQIYLQFETSDVQEEYDRIMGKEASSWYY